MHYRGIRLSFSLKVIQGLLIQVIGYQVLPPGHVKNFSVVFVDKGVSSLDVSENP